MINAYEICNIIMYLKSFQSTPPLFELTQPTNTTEPTLQWVVLIGSPIFDARSTVNAAPISIVNPLKLETILSFLEWPISNKRVLEKQYIQNSYVEAVIFVRSSPIVWMTRRPHNHSPTEIPSPPYNRM